MDETGKVDPAYQELKRQSGQEPEAEPVPAVSDAKVATLTVARPTTPE